MKKKIFARNAVIAGIAALFLFSNTAWAYWVWTPGTKKFINPKNAVKDSPKEQFDWGMNFYNAKDFQRAATEFEKLGWEKDLLGLYVSSHPLNSFKKLFEKRTVQISKVDATYVDKKIIVGGMIASIKKIITKKGQPMLFMKVEDLSGKVEVVIFPNLLERNPRALQENKIVFVAGRVDDRNGEIKIVADDVQEILIPREA